MLLMFKKYSPFFLLTILIYFPIFGGLNVLPIRIFDEARLAMNALEMERNGNWLIPYFEGKPDMWSTKPPFMIWCQVFCIKLFGPTEFAIRFPSAIATLATIWLLFIFLTRYTHNKWFAVVTGLVLITSMGYVDLHSTRTGDYDAMLTFFIIASGIFFFLFLQKKQNVWLYAFFAAITLGGLTKGIQALIFVPIFLSFAIGSKQFLPLLKNKAFYVGFIFPILFIGGYYILREQYNPGYLSTVIKNELGGRYLHVIEDHQHGFWYYFHLIAIYQMKVWFWFIPLGIITILFSDQRIKRITGFSIFVSMGYLLIISISQTKLDWYSIPILPFIAIVVANGIYSIFIFIRRYVLSRWKIVSFGLAFCFLVLIFYDPYKWMYQKTMFPKEHSYDEDFYASSYYLQDIIRGKRNLTARYFIDDGYNPQHKFYLIGMQQKGMEIEYIEKTDLASGNKVIVYQYGVKEYIISHYTYEITETFGNITVYNIHGSI